MPERIGKSGALRGGTRLLAALPNPGSECLGGMTS